MFVLINASIAAAEDFHDVLINTQYIVKITPHHSDQRTHLIEMECGPDYFTRLTFQELSTLLNTTKPAYDILEVLPSDLAANNTDRDALLKDLEAIVQPLDLEVTRLTQRLVEYETLGTTEEIDTALKGAKQWRQDLMQLKTAGRLFIRGRDFNLDDNALGFIERLTKEYD